MTVTYGFYNAVNNDRLYDAKQMSRLFQGIIADGIFSSIGSKLMVTSAAGMNVTIGTGRAWFNNTWTDNDTPMVLALTASHMTLNRIDTVVLEINTSEAVRANSIKVVSGVAASSPVAPTLNPPAEVYQYPLADLYIGAGVTTLSQGNITNRVGTASTPFITGAITSVTTDQLIANWEAQFTTWFDAMKGQLSTDAAGNLQTQINALKANRQQKFLLDLLPHLSSMTRNISGLVLDHTAYNAGSCTFRVPSDWVPGTPIYIKFIVMSEGMSGNIRVNGFARWSKTNEAYYGGGTEINFYSTLAIGSSIWTPILPLTLNNLEADDVISATLERDGVSGLDTVLSNLLVAGVLVEYTANR